MKEYALEPQKKWGQNFCIEPALLDIIKAKILELHPENILEIGGGLGTLSNVIAQLNIPLTILEKDVNFCLLLERRFRTQNVVVKNVDALKYFEYHKYSMIIGNIPYEISSLLLFRIWQNFGENKSFIFPDIIFTVQKEFGLRLAAKSKTQMFSRLGAMTQLISSPIVLKIYPPNAFFPTPKVAHAVVWLKPLKNIPFEVFTKEFVNFMINLFNRKNKTVLSALRPQIKHNSQRKEIEAIFSQNPLFSKRVKDLEPFECIRLYKFYVESFTKLSSTNDNTKHS